MLVVGKFAAAYRFQTGKKRSYEAAHFEILVIPITDVGVVNTRHPLVRYVVNYCLTLRHEGLSVP